MNFLEARSAFEKLFSSKMNEAEARSLLIQIHNDGETTEEIRAATEVMRENSIKLTVDSSIQDTLIDNCGTGGDKSCSFNISTTVSIVLASLNCYVAKHGNRSITSNSGSADMLEALGVKLSLNLEQKRKILEDCGFVFLFAVDHHPAMKHIMPIRKSISHRTIFNILGPLTNPANAKRHLIGVFNYDFAKKMAEVLKSTGSTKGYVLCSNDGLDEVSVCDTTMATYFDEYGVKELEINPFEFGIKKATSTELLGGDAVCNAKITYDLLKDSPAGAKSDIVVINTAIALIAAGKARDTQDAVEMARMAIKSKIAFRKLEEIVKVSNSI